VFFLNCWAGLYDEADARKIEEGAKLLMNKVMHLTQNMLPLHLRMVPMF
jgi:hypothetical protein